MAEKNNTGAFQSATSSNEKDVKYKGVRKRKWGKWVSEIRLPNSRERIWLGSYNTPEKAARAFDAALFCLRGRNAAFNFPDSPPVNITGGRSLTPDEIQAIASRYANEYEEGQLQTAGNDDGETNAYVTEMEDASASSSFGHVARMESMDWSFLETLEPPHGANITTVRDYSLISGMDVLHENMYMQPNMGSRNYDENNDDHSHGYNDGAVSYAQHSFLWNF